MTASTVTTSALTRPSSPAIEIAGEMALLVTFGDRVDSDLLAQVRAATALLQAEQPPWLVGLIPSYASLLVLFDPNVIDRVRLRRHLRRRLAELEGSTDCDSALIELPVYYSPESGPDLARVAQRAGCTADEVIALHSDTEYRVYALGFAPGFAYLGEVPERLATPRLATPRASVPRGAVAIADRQTAVYPLVTPGGWNVIGLCPTPLFDPGKDPPTPWQIGDRVRFRPVDRDEFQRLGGVLS